MGKRIIAKAGSRAAASENGSSDSLFDMVVARHSRMITRIALAHEADPALRRDLVQEIMLAIWGSLLRFRRDSLSDCMTETNA